MLIFGDCVWTVIYDGVLTVFVLLCRANLEDGWERDVGRRKKKNVVLA